MSVKASLLPQGRYANANTKKIKEAKKIKEEGGGDIKQRQDWFVKIMLKR